MKRFFDNLLVDLVAGALMIGMLATGYLLRFPLPPGSNKDLMLWGLSRHQWGDLHFWISIGLLGVVLLHVCLHWKWIVVSVRRQLCRPATSGSSPLFSGLTVLLALLAILFLFGWAAKSSVQTISEPGDGRCLPTGLDEERDTKVANNAPVSFWEDVYPILQNSCLSCHGPNKQRGDFRADRKEDYLGRGESPPLVVPGRSAESPLIALVAGQRKDLPRADVHHLPEDQIAILKAWIDEGAPWPEKSAR